jgi:hypothetical protein
MYLRLGAMNYNYYSYTYFKIITVYLDVTEMYFPVSCLFSGDRFCGGNGHPS